MKIKILHLTCIGLFVFVLFGFSAQAQNIAGKIVDSDTGEDIIGVTIQVEGTNITAITDFDGQFSLTVADFPLNLKISFVGYTPQVLNVTSATQKLTIKLVAGLLLDAVVVTGSRGKPRTVLTSPVPIDNINAAQLKESGQMTVDQMINFKVPSFNSTPQAISDASAHFDPSELRNLGPSRTLVLINGKRKNQSSQVYLNKTPGTGEVGTDLKAIPIAAIERIEVLRDGASAQYGSDAVAGVINIILKERVKQTEISLESGVTSKGDGFNYATDINMGFKIGEKGFINLTLSGYHTDKTNRAAEPRGDSFFGDLYAIGKIKIGAAIGFEATPGVLATGKQIRDGDTDWQRANPDLGMTIGLPEQDRYSLYANLGIPYEKGDFYVNVGYTFRYGKSFALYSTPWWPGIGQRGDNPLWTDRTQPFPGFQPTFESDIKDLTLTVGNKFFLNDWTIDLSATTGFNDIQYSVRNSINTSLGANGPTEFNPGGYKFGIILGNLDISKQFGDVSFFAGAEFRNENYEVRAGEKASYTGGGAQSFPGLQPSNALNESRTNVGLYTGLDYDINESFLIGGAFRFEKYSKIGNGSSIDNFSWKLNARQIIGDKKGAIRTSVSTGFRAPSLHQIYLSNIQTLLVGNDVAQQGTFNNVSDITRIALQVPQLDAETSINYTAGITYKLTNNFTATFDYYKIDVNDRVLLTNQISTASLPDGNTVRTNLESDGVESFKFFINAADSKTQGIDLVLNYDRIHIGNDQLGFLAAVNWNKTKINSEELKSPPVFAENNIDIFNREEIGRLKTGRPNVKGSLGVSYKTGKFRLNLNNTYFGEVTETHASNASLDQVFSAKTLTDLTRCAL